MPQMPTPLQTMLDSSVVRYTQSVLESTLFRSPEPAPSRTAATFDWLFGTPVPYLLSLFSQVCRVVALAIVLPIFLVGLLDFVGYAVFRTLGLHRQRVRLKRTQAADTPPRFVKRTPRVYQSDRGRPTDNSNMPSIVKAPLLSPGTYDAETLLRHRARSLSAASEGFDDRAYISSGGYFARVGVKHVAPHLHDDDGISSVGLLSPPASASEGEDAATQPNSVRVPGIGVEGALGFQDTDAESGTESGRNSPVQRFATLQGRPSSAGGGEKRRGGWRSSLKFTPVKDQPVPKGEVADERERDKEEKGAGENGLPWPRQEEQEFEAQSLEASWIGIHTSAAAVAADLEDC
ncbi:hypothetical protein ACQY0O_001050 [Thecaphora frezii]